MITVGFIRNGATYLSRHLRKNDYWSEGEKEVQGEWIGESAKALGLTGAVTDAPFESLRENRHPRTGEPLTARDQANRVAFFDVQLSAPKDVSVLAMVGGDVRVRDAFKESVTTALAEMERFPAVRERRDEAAGSEAYRLTGNIREGVSDFAPEESFEERLQRLLGQMNNRALAAVFKYLDASPTELVLAILRAPTFPGFLGKISGRLELPDFSADGRLIGRTKEGFRGESWGQEGHFVVFADNVVVTDKHGEDRLETNLHTFRQQLLG